MKMEPVWFIPIAPFPQQQQQLWWDPWRVQVTWMHSRGIFCVQKKRDRLNSFFPTQIPAPHLSHSPLCLGASLGKAQELLGWGRRRRIAEFLPGTLQPWHNPGGSSFVPRGCGGAEPSWSRAQTLKPGAGGSGAAPGLWDGEGLPRERSLAAGRVDRFSIFFCMKVTVQII